MAGVGASHPFESVSGPIRLEWLREARPLLDALPYAVLHIGPDHQVRWMNEAGRAAYGSKHSRCYAVTHGRAEPCVEQGLCPLEMAIASRSAHSVTHVHTAAKGTGFTRVTALPIEGDGVLELHLPLGEELTRDTLTGLWARGYFEQMVQRQLAVLDRMGQGFAVLLLDLDHFKGVNDRLGHPGGDAALSLVGSILLRQSRSADTCGRWGGDELVVFCPTVHPEGAQVFAQRLRTRVREATLAPPWEHERVTVSIGAAQGLPGQPFSTVLDRADQALYRAKAGGRDRVEWLGASTRYPS